MYVQSYVVYNKRNWWAMAMKLGDKLIGAEFYGAM